MKTIALYELKRTRANLSEACAPYGRKITCLWQVFEVCHSLIGDSGVERFIVIHLDAANRVIGASEVARGGVDACAVDPREVFRTSLMLGASSIIISHCHPSGITIPSNEDKTLTKRIKHAAKILGIGMLDHVIVAGNSTFSFAEAELMGDTEKEA